MPTLSITGTGNFSIPKNANQTMTALAISGTYSGLTFTVLGSFDSINFGNIAVINRSSETLTAGGTGLTPSNNSTYLLDVPSNGMTEIQINVSAVTGTPLLTMNSGNWNPPVQTINTTGSIINSSAPTVITATSTGAFVVGPNGSTNPTLNVNTNTASAATGVTVVSAAGGSGVEIQATSSSTNEAMNIDAKAAANIVLAGQASTATGVQIGSATSAANCVATVYSSNATAFQVGPNGSTNPTFVVNSATASAATGLKVTGAAATGGVAMQVISSSTVEALTIDAKAGAAITLGGAAASATGVNIGSATSAANVVATVYSSNATAFQVGPNGSTNPSFLVNTNTASAATGVKITSAAAGAGVLLAAISSSTVESIKVDGKSTGGVYLNRVALQSLVTGVTLTSATGKQSYTTGDVTAANWLGGIVSLTGTTGGGTVTLPSGAGMSTAMPLTPATGDSFTTLFANPGTTTLTITGTTGTTVIGTAAIGTLKNAWLEWVETGSNAWSIYVTCSA